MTLGEVSGTSEPRCPHETPGLFLCPDISRFNGSFVYRYRTPLFQGGEMGSIPIRVIQKVIAAESTVVEGW